MRLTEFEISTIKNLTKVHFGKNAEVYLFGSRTDNHKKGGDIDLFISITMNEDVITVETKVYFLAELKTKIGDRKIDVVFDNANKRQKKNFYSSVMHQKT